AMVLFVNRVLTQRLHANLEKEGLFIAKKLAIESINPILGEQLFELQMMVHDVKNSEENIEYIYVEDADGEPLAHTFKDGFPADLRGMSSESHGQTSAVQHLETEKGPILDFSVPMLKGMVGYVHVGVSEAPILENVHEVVRLLVFTIIGVLVLGGGMATALAASITRPIHQFVEAVHSVERGDLNARVPVQSSDEIGRLATAFNSMAETRMQVEQALQASEKRVRDIAANLAEGLYVLDRQGKITFMNPEAERLLGWTMDELNEKGAHNLVHFRRADGSPLPQELCALHGVTTTRRNYTSADEVFVRKDGTVFPISVVSSPIIEGGEPVASVTAFRDISRQKELQQEREQLLLAYQDAMENIKILKGLLPICASCKRIRDDSGYWTVIESYVRDHSEAEFSHGLCPECAKKLYPEYTKDDKT
ncbi:MAG TPA: PAS domain S-box protein, partial [Nitrospirota bacterium]